MGQLKTGIIGLGVGEAHIPGFETDTCCVSKICDFNPEKLSEVSSRHPEYSTTTNPEDILLDDETDIVSIASYDQYHCDQIVMALENGKHVFVEKPLCLTTDELARITEALRSHPGLKLSSNLILRKSPRFIALKEKCEEGQLGQLYYLEGDYDYGRIEKITDGWRGDIPFYSVTHGGGIHLIDLLLWLSEGRVEEVFAYGNKIATQKSKFKYKSLTSALLKFENGIIAKVTSNFGSVTPHHHKLCLYGTKGSFIQSHLGAHYLTSRERGQSETICDEDYPGVLKDGLIPDFLAHISGTGEAGVKTQEILDAMAVSLAIEKALETGQACSPNYMLLDD